MKKIRTLNCQGFAISGIIYSLLILFVLLLTALLTLLASRKIVLDKINQSLLNGLNGESDIAFRFDYKHVVIANTSKVQNFTFDLLDGVSVISHQDKKKLPDAKITYTSSPTFNSAVNGIYKITYTAKYGIYEIREQRIVEVANPLFYEYTYTGSPQTFNAPSKGVYQFQLWGAQGGGPYGGKGAYTRGNLPLNSGDKFYVYVGQHLGTGGVTAAYNGGGAANSDGRYHSGGGATDIRTVSGAWNQFDSLKARIMIAAGGGGCYYYSESSHYEGGYGGALVGGSGNKENDAANEVTVATGGTQTEGGKAGIGTNTSGSPGNFGSGGIGNTYLAGGGGGYYGGGSSGVANTVASSGGGGSSYISGYPGCNAIANTSTSTHLIHTGSANHYSGYSFQKSVMIAGYTTSASMPNHAGTAMMVGNEGHGYGKITALVREMQTESLPVYVQDALYVHYDGFMKGNDTTKWQDVSGNSRNGTLSGLTASSFTTDHGLLLDGIDDYVDTGFMQTVLDQQMTISTVMKATDLASYRGIWGYYAKNDDKTSWAGTSAQASSNTFMRFQYFAGGGMNPGVNVPSAELLNKKVQVTVTIHGGVGIKVYLNGSLYGHEESNGVFLPYVSSNRNFVIGRSASLEDRFFKGTIYNFMIYKKVLTEEEIQENYTLDKARFGL